MENLVHKTDNVPVALAQRLLETAEELGFDVTDCLVSAGIERADITKKSNHVTYEQQQNFVEAVVMRLDKPGLGLLVGQKVSILDWGILGYAFISSPNLYQAFEVFSTYQRVNGPMLNIYCLEDEDEDEGIIDAIEAFPLMNIHMFAIEEWLAETRVVFDRFDILDMDFTEVHLTYPEPDHADMYRDLFQCPIYFNQERNSIHFPTSALRLPFNMADEVVSELCIRQCAEVLKHLSDEDPVVDAVRRVLLTKPGITPTLTFVADHLHISARTLRRRLHDAGTSYKDILSSVRLGLAAEYLRSGRMAPKQIAYLMGYSGVTSFHRAFKNLFKLTPSEYRTQYSDSGQQR